MIMACWCAVQIVASDVMTLFSSNLQLRHISIALNKAVEIVEIAETKKKREKV